MKYLKTFERLNRDIKKGDYAIINFEPRNQGISVFFKNNICKIIDIRGTNPIWIKFGYEYVPDELIECFDKKGKYYVYHIELYSSDVEKYARTKKELELELQANKFNL